MMTQYPASNISVLSEGNENYLEDTEADVSWLPKEFMSFGGEPYLNEIMQQKRPKGITKFRSPGRRESDY